MMGRHGESIYKRKDGRWEARYIASRDASGHAIYRSLYAKSYKEVKAKRKDVLRQRETPQVSGCFSGFITQWLAEKAGTVKEQTLRKYRTNIRTHIEPFFANCSPADITAERVGNFMDELRQKGLSDNSIRGIAVLLQSILDFTARQSSGTIPSIRIKKPRAQKKAYRILNYLEQQCLESSLGEHPCGSDLAIYLALHTGLRLGEVCALRWENIDFAAQQMHISHTVVRGEHGDVMLDSPKSATSERVLPIPVGIVSLLREEMKHSSSQYVFHAPRRGTFLNPRTLQYRFRAKLRENGLPNVTFHALRHTFATRWIECGMDVKSLSEYLGHSGVQITLDIYVHSSAQLKREGIERLEAFYGQKTGQASNAVR